MTPSHAMFPIPDSEAEGRKGNAEGRGWKGQVQCEKGIFGHRMDMSRVEQLLQWFLCLSMNVEECFHNHALCFKIRTTVL